MIQFVTACDAAYAAQNLALYRSLERHQTGDWQMLWVVLGRSDYIRARVWQGERRDTPRLLLCDGDYIAGRDQGLTNALRSREGSPAWFWTWASAATALACDTWPEATNVYVDSDCWALDDWAPAVAEAGGADVGMLGHRLPTHRLATHGSRGGWWCGFQVFRPTRRARAAAAWWAAMVKASCEVHEPADDYLQIPAGFAGDQAPLHGLDRMADVAVIRRPGFVASWNWDGPADGDPWLAHFHEFRFHRDGTLARGTGYPTPADIQEAIVDPYCAAVIDAAGELLP